MNLERSFAETSAPAKIILFGEHFVVYNKPAILASVTKRIKVGAHLNNSKTINIKSDLGIQGSYKDSNFKLIKGGNDSQTILYPLYASARSVLSERHQILGLDIVVNSEFPYGIGLGSSAASCVATVAAVDSLFHKPDKQYVCDKAIKSERLIHNSSSGADCYISTFGGLMYYKKNEGFNKIYNKKDLSLIIGNTGIRHSTGVLVASVKKFKDKNSSLFNNLSRHAENICKDAFTAITKGDEKKLGKLMIENHTLLQHIGVSHDKIDYLVNLCIENGALGAKLTGAGGGGIMIALVPQEQKLKIISTIEKNGGECIAVEIDFDGLILY
ncbi:MAG TPA: mevalonate kinase [Nitrososphaeraceae archaeon]|nr:mevalonate kinase [Nitrososphaeraceae archaeon]